METPFEKAGIAGRATVRCAVGDQGDLVNCQLVQETPGGSGWGKAVLSLTAKYKRKPPTEKDSREATIVEGWYPMDKAPDWLRKPTADDLLTVYPTEAFRRGQNGKAIISCLNTVQGKLTECVALDESPAGAGFGGAAIALTPQFLMRPAMLGGKPVVSMIRIPINFITFGPAPSSSTSKKVAPPNLAWADAPSYAEVAAAFPKKAREEHRSGRVTLACGMNEQGRLKECVVATSDPKGYGFDAAAKTLAKRFGFPVATDADRKATHQLVIHLPITFDAATLDQAAPVVGKPTWASIPSDRQISAAFGQLKVTGTARVRLTCVVQPGGTVSDCAVVSEAPAGAGLGAAALSLAPAFRLSTWTTEGLPVVGGTIGIPLRYDADAAPASPAATK